MTPGATSRPAKANVLPDGFVVACYGCGRSGVVQGQEVHWSSDAAPLPDAVAQAVLCPACWRAPGT